MRLFDSSGAGPEASSLLPALFAVLLAIVFWMLADTAHEKLSQVEIQVSAAQRAARRGADNAEINSMQTRLENARAEKEALMARLQTTESAEMIRARMVYDLRQKCEATGASVCRVRLADDTIAAATSASGAASRPSSTPAPVDVDKRKLIDLGIQKARAIVSGSFQNDEVAALSKRLHSDPNAYWRINGLIVRGTTFEFDVERHIITKPQGGA